MRDLRRKLAAPEDPKGRLISIFVGAVLLPSLALSYVSWHFVKKLAATEKESKKKRAESILYYLEKDLQRAAQQQATEAAQVVGLDRLLDGRPQVVQPALRAAGIGDDVFETLRLEGASPRAASARQGEGEDMREVLAAVAPMPAGANEDAAPWIGADGRITGTLRFKYTCGYLHQRLIRDYFEKEFRNPELVVRVTEPDGRILYETRSTTTQRFEVNRKMESPAFRDLKMFLRYRDVTIEQDVNHWKMGTFALVGFIDVMLGAGLLLVYSNVRREMHLSRLKSDFVANVSHELKTPLALVRLFAETLEMGRVQSGEKAQEYYRVINKESQRLTQLINNILDFSRIEAGRKEYRLSPVSVGRVVASVLETYRFQIEQQGFTLEEAVPPDLPLVDADEEALTQALLNLVNNAIKYSRDDKHIRVEARRDGGDVRLSVVDRGIGVAKPEQKKIFEKFYRAEDSLVHETKGSGLGLSLVKHIMDAHGGRIEVESTPGRGSVFTLVLPARRPE
ncbi:MAG TPA: ATP-binding protein [Vicinamibacteria bacterium]|nr:ATP-binding protein [Vicinamibacteria bacterium]